MKKELSRRAALLKMGKYSSLTAIATFSILTPALAVKASPNSKSFNHSNGRYNDHIPDQADSNAQNH